jgi:dienelactone hydrolase
MSTVAGKGIASMISQVVRVCRVLVAPVSPRVARAALSAALSSAALSSAAIAVTVLPGCSEPAAPRSPADEPTGSAEGTGAAQGATTSDAIPPGASPGAVVPPSAPSVTPGVPRGPAETIDVFFHALGGREFSQARGMFDADLQKALSEEQLAKVWSAQTEALGPLESVRSDAGVERGGKLVHSVDLAFEQGSLTATVALDQPSHELAGLFLRPGRTPGTTAPYADPAAFRNEEVSVGKDPFILAGTLTLPVGAGPFPAVVLVHGSGPMDRDETVIANKPFKDIAEGLASRGVAVLRYDKRTFAHATRLSRDISVDDEVVVDATLALEALRARKEVDPKRVFVLGHSMGALLAPEIATRSKPVAGLILLAPPGRPPWDVVVDQMRYLGVPADMLAATEKDAAAVKKGTAGSQLLGAPAAYWRDLAGRDGIGKSRQLHVPLLILRGERDYQVTDADLAAWRKGLGTQPNVAIETLASDNHLFIPGSGKPGPAEFAKPGHVDEALITRVAAFIQPSASSRAPAAPH